MEGKGRGLGSGVGSPILTGGLDATGGVVSAPLHVLMHVHTYLLTDFLSSPVSIQTQSLALRVLRKRKPQETQALALASSQSWLPLLRPSIHIGTGLQSVACIVIQKDGRKDDNGFRPLYGIVHRLRSNISAAAAEEHQEPEHGRVSTGDADDQRGVREVLGQRCCQLQRQIDGKRSITD